MKKIVLALGMLCAQQAFAQDLNHMQWFNEPAQWSIKNQELKMQVTPQSDYWVKTHYGFTVDDGPFLYTLRGGEFETSVKIEGAYKSRYDQMGLMLRVDEKHWIKTGIEYVDGVYHFSVVTTNGVSSWGVTALKEKPDAIWIKATRRRDGVEIFYSTDGKNYAMAGLSYLPEQVPVKVGMMAASPDGDGFEATFKDFKVKHLADERRLEWLKDHQ
ncbi:DUF1349 domain-containing protein [Persicobacter psychrovividus]|uniref:DUF1349 domain-containing protein n=1 Tax=Persicobacter psychrovividus TaxID=387638 RepID=A0ABM7VH25_9BACT|nr:hypothetical protein PEPS_25600 [Persicobacter psychrovividus]